MMDRMRWLERRREMRRLRKLWLREHRGGAYVISTQMDPDYDPPSGSMNPDPDIWMTTESINQAKRP